MRNKVGFNYLNKLYVFYFIYLQNIKIVDFLYVNKALKFYSKGNYKQAINHFNKMKNFDNPNVCFKVGMCFFREKNWAEAEYYFDKAIQNKIYKQTWLIQLYQARVRVSQSYATDNQKLEYFLSSNEVKESENNFIENAKSLILKKNYSSAISLLERQIFLYPLNCELWFLLGCVYDEFQSFDKSSYYFKNAYELNLNSRNYKYRYAYALERNSQIELADELYSQIVESSKDEVKSYGIGILHAKRGLWLDSAQALIKVKDTADYEMNLHLYHAYFFSLDYESALFYLEQYIANCNIVDSALFYKLAKTYFLNENYSAALINYNKYIDRAENLLRHEHDEYLKCLLMTNNLSNENYNYNLHIFPSFEGIVKSASFIKSNQDKFWNKYIYYAENLPIREQYYFFESFAGASVSCSPYAMLLELLSRADDRQMYVVVCDDTNKIPTNLFKKSNIIFVTKNSNLYIRYLATSKYLINNTTFSPYFYRRDAQVYLMTWHGTPIKSLGRDQKNGFMSHANVTRNFLHATHIISPNPHTTDIVLNRYDIKDLYQGKFYEVGYPRVDLTLSNQLISKADLGVSEDKKIVLYAPTWRGGEKLEGEVDVEQLIDDLKKISNNSDIVLFYKSHHLIENILKDMDLPVRLVPKNIDINVFLSVVDCLISDYSSIIFDYLPLNKPVISYIYDYDEYVLQRGELYFKKNELFGYICETLSEVEDILLRLGGGNLNVDYTQYLENYCPYDKGESAKNVVDILHSESNLEPMYIHQKPVNIMFCGSFLPNGVTNSFKNLIKAASTFEDSRFALVFDINAVQSKVDNYESFQDIIDLPIILIGRLGSAMSTSDEKWLKSKMEVQHDFFNDKTKGVIFNSYRRELKRIFGDATFKNVINFDGYSIFWIILLSLFESSRKIIYLHSSMYGEWKTRFPYLKTVFSMYEHYDQLNSVSEACYNNNLYNFTNNIGIHVKQSYANNVIDHEKILQLANVRPENIIKDFDGFDGIKFINVARLSVEKDQEKLIRAFNVFQGSCKENVRLYIVGYGPLEESLRDLITSLKLENKVYLLGYQSNPYYFMSKSDLFVFSSNYEGQGLVLLESMILDLPTITTDIEGVQSVVKGTNILAVENSIEGLSSGMHEYILGHVKATVFDYCEYNRVAITHFKALLEVE